MQDLDKEFGIDRVMDSPVSEDATTGVAIGASLAGFRPIVVHPRMDFVILATNQIVNQAAKNRYMFGGKATLPIVYRAATGAGIGNAAQHTQSLEAWFTHIPGLKVVTPSNAYDAKGLLKAAIRDNNVVVFLEHKALYASRGNVPEGEYLVPLGVSELKRTGTDLTIVSYSRQVVFALQAAEQLASEGIEVEVVDLRTLYPMDIGTAIASVQKTNRALVVHEAVQFGGFGGEIASQIQEQAFDYLDAPVVRLGALHSPVPFSEPLEFGSFPSVERIVESAKGLLAGA